MNNHKIYFWQSIRFKLAATYSVIIFVAFALFLGLFNLYMRAYFFQTPQETATLFTTTPFIPPIVVERFSRLQEGERARIIQTRRQDFERIQLISVISLIPILGMSVITGYLLSGDFLNPLKQLQAKIATRSAKNLNETIDYSGPQDEVGAIISSFNDMSQQLHQAFRRQEEFVQNASHELKTPLAIQQANLELLVEGYKPGSEEYEALGAALNAIKRMQKLVEDLLTLAEVDGEVSKELVNLHELLQEIAAELAPMAKDAGVALRIRRLSKALKELSVSANRSQLYTALFAILENGIKYTAGSKDAEVAIELSQENDLALIKISDNGPGIAPTHLENIFERFYRADSSRSRATGGHGLGLAIAKEIIEAHGGEISVESSEKGSSFTVTFS